ncbi:hypothetical protein K402DRAFT_323726 [Aulographum hederae CBS 113979]|uniref:Uncharacterized protein n=1 Tax=Aulographum hederae CBS 113979 TaxID=1176131 RepID=A0A6G1HCZ2_9PEZI|nr:hypothetical protein K402DRAFT_323726 [Aulographum hederae CBS 113979]
MPSLLLTVFVLQVIIHLINTIGAQAINELLWLLYNKLPTPTSSAARDQIRLQKEIIRLRRERAAISAQDNFTKWAKLGRQLDKVVAEHEKSTSSLSSVKSTFDSTATTIRWLLTNGLRFYLQYRYAREPLFWLPHGWIPTYVEWIMAFPRAPRGSVSVQVWFVACSSIVKMVGEAAGSGYVLGRKAGLGEKEKRTEEPMKMGKGGEKSGEKKEL